MTKNSPSHKHLFLGTKWEKTFKPYCFEIKQEYFFRLIHGPSLYTTNKNIIGLDLKTSYFSEEYCFVGWTDRVEGIQIVFLRYPGRMK